MLQHTFMHVPGVGAETDRLLRVAGITSWDLFEERALLSQLPARLIDKLMRYLDLSREALQRRDIDFFAATLPRSEHWRLYPAFADQFVFLDIETTGLSRYYNEITLVGLFDGARYDVLVSGHNLGDLPKAMERFRGIVTFNGTLFDLPFIRSALPGVQLPVVHVDLRFLLRRLGFSGGLKAVEIQVGIIRPENIQDIEGYEATLLWHRYTRGDLDSLNRLIQYNFFDVLTLKYLVDHAVNLLAGGFQGSAQEPPPAPHVDWERSWTDAVQNLPPLRPFDDSTNGNGKSEPHRPSFHVDALLPLIPEPYPRVVGIDLTASERRGSGWAVMDGSSIRTATFHTDQQLIDATVAESPRLVSIDAPLSIPLGRDCMEEDCECRRFGIMRECERELRRRGLMVYPCLLPSMKNLTRRGMELAKRFREIGIEVIESYPGAGQDILDVPRKKTNLDELRRSMARMGFTGEPIEEIGSHDELDAIMSALVGYFYVCGLTENLGDQSEGLLAVPRKDLSLLLDRTLATTSWKTT